MIFVSNQGIASGPENMGCMPQALVGDSHSVTAANVTAIWSVVIIRVVAGDEGSGLMAGEADESRNVPGYRNSFAALGETSRDFRPFSLTLRLLNGRGCLRVVQFSLEHGHDSYPPTHRVPILAKKRKILYSQVRDSFKKIAYLITRTAVTKRLRPAIPV